MSWLSLPTLRATPPVQLHGIAIAGASFASLITALGFEHIGGYDPCPLCLIERIAYYGAVPAGMLAALLARMGYDQAARGLLLLCALGFAINAGIGVYHSGVEWKWWPGPATCAGAGADGFSTEDLMKGLEQARIVRCDEAPWRFLGFSFAGWSALISAALAGLSFHGVWRRPAGA